MKRSSIKHKNNKLDIKITQILQQSNPSSQNHKIFFQSDDEELSQHHDLVKQKEANIMPTLKIESPDEDLHSNELQEENVFEESSQLAKLEQINKKSPIIQAQSFQVVEEIDFELYTSFMAKSKIYGALLIDSFGKVLWCDKLAHELLEGSLNNLAKNPIHSLLLNSELPNYIRQLRQIDFKKQKTLHWIIYSKNTRRRYKNIPFSRNPSHKEIFYRFLKALTVRIRPIAICLPTYRDKNGFCNQKLIPQQQKGNCFFLQLRLSKRFPDLRKFHIMNDFIIKKFINNIKLQSFKINVGNEFDIYGNNESDIILDESEDEDDQSEEQMSEQGKKKRKKVKRVKTMIMKDHINKRGLRKRKIPSE